MGELTQRSLSLPETQSWTSGAVRLAWGFALTPQCSRDSEALLYLTIAWEFTKSPCSGVSPNQHSQNLSGETQALLLFNSFGQPRWRTSASHFPASYINSAGRRLCCFGVLAAETLQGEGSCLLTLSGLWFGSARDQEECAGCFLLTLLTPSAAQL